MSSLPPIRYLDRTTPPHITTLVLIAGVAALSLNVFLPSLPSMAAHFGVDYALMQLSLSLYLATTAVLQIFIGPISDRFGRRPVMLGAILVYILATALALLAPTFGIFLACRLAQATIATGFVLSRAVVRDMVPQDQAASMIGYVTMGMSVVPMIGPVIGGALDDAFGWQASFGMLGAAGLGLLVLVWADMGETTRGRPTSMSAQFRQYPGLLTSQRFWGYCLAAAFASGAFFAYLGGAPYVGSQYFAMNAATLGAYFGAPAMGYMAGNFLSGRFSVRFGVNRMVLWGGLLSCAGMTALALVDLAGLSGQNMFFLSMISIGVGNGLVMPNANAGMLSIRPHLAGTAAGLGGAFMIGGGAALAALAGFILTPESGPLPLIVLMLITSALGVVCILWVMHRERVLKRRA